MENFLRIAGNHVLSILLLVFGFFLLNVYLRGSGLEVQGQGMIISAILLIVLGILTLPVIMSKITKPIRIVLTIVAMICVAGVAYGTYNSMKSEIDFLANEKLYNSEVIQNFKDIRRAETAFEKINHRFTKDISGELVDFVNAEVIPVPVSEGMFIEAQNIDDPEADPDEEVIGVGNGSEQTYRDKGFIIKYADVDSIATMLEMESNDLLLKIRQDLINYKVRDTVYVSLWSQRFTDEIREKKNLPIVNLDSWGVNPNGERYKIKVGSIKEGDADLSVIHVLDPTPYGREGVKRDTLQFGSMYNAHTDGSWRRTN